jgi:hypothetical protein
MQPSKERASAVSFAFSGLHVGSMVGLLSSPLIIQAAGWEALFATYGLAGAAWLLGARALADHVSTRDPELAAALTPLLGSSQDATSITGSSTSPVAQQPGIPYRAFLRSEDVRVLMFTHFCHNWCELCCAPSRDCGCVFITFLCHRRMACRALQNILLPHAPVPQWLLPPAASRPGFTTPCWPGCPPTLPPR